MSLHSQKLAWLATLAVYAALCLPVVRHWLEASMTMQMLVQFPLLISTGWIVGINLRHRATGWLDEFNEYGITGIILVTVVTSVWMLPFMLDLAATNVMVDAWKYLTLPLLVGMPMALSWPRMGFVLRGVFVSEFIAMFFRLGWLYLILPSRVCNNYLLDDQQVSGKLMLGIGIVLVLVVAIKLIWGRFDHLETSNIVHEN